MIWNYNTPFTDRTKKMIKNFIEKLLIMSIAPISNDNIKVGYISEDDGYVKGKSIAQANAYEALNPGTVYIFLNGDNKVEYLSIDEVNAINIKKFTKN